MPTFAGAGVGVTSECTGESRAKGTLSAACELRPHGGSETPSSGLVGLPESQ